MNTSATVQTPSYLANLFPEFNDADVAAGTAVYANQGAPIDQAVAIMGECRVILWIYVSVLKCPSFLAIFICPTYFLLRAFKNKGFKVDFLSEHPINDTC